MAAGVVVYGTGQSYEVRGRKNEMRAKENGMRRVKQDSGRGHVRDAKLPDGAGVMIWGSTVGGAINTLLHLITTS